MERSQFFTAVYRLKDVWAFSAQGVFGAGFYRTLEPVHVFKLDEWESVVQTLLDMAEAGNPETVPPTRQEMEDTRPFLSAIGIPSWSELHRYCYLWNLTVGPGGVTADLFERRKKKPILTKSLPTLMDAIDSMATFTYNF